MRYILILLISTLLYADSCERHFYKNQVIKLENTKEICYSEFSIVYSPSLKIPLLTAEYITKDELILADTVSRSNSFHVDANLAITESQLGSDYVGQGYDRGHSASSADMPSIQSEFESFTYANMTPQVPNNNRGSWKKLETKVRNYVKSTKSLFVINGIVPGENNMNGINIPYAYYKIIITDTEYSIYLTYNVKNSTILKITLDDLHELTEIRYTEYLSGLKYINLLNL